ncbi:hypothetical protein ACOMHN_017688 [Nucella lapillus]
MMTPLDMTSMLVGGVLALTFLWWRSTRRPAGIPPGPGLALPLLGHLHLLERDPRAKFSQWRQQYGDIFSLYLGNHLVIVLNGYSVLREAFVKCGEVFSDRPHMFITDRISKERGVVMSSGTTWKEQRKTSLGILREMGMGKNVLAEKIQEEVGHFIQAVENLEGKPADLNHLTTVSVSNNICSIVFGKRFEYDDPVFAMYLNNLEENVKKLSGAAIINFFPFLEFLPCDPLGVRKILSNVQLIEDKFFQPIIDKHWDTFPQDEATDFIYAYMREMKKKEQQGALTTLCDSEMMKTVGDLFVAGTETTAGVIKWALLYFLHHPHVQENCYKEVCDVIGTNRLPNIQDRGRMVYLEATINEVLRFADIAPFAVQHTTLYDVELQGYVIPKQAIILPSLDSVLNDPKAWGDPENFRPERFINDEGKLVKPEEFIPFGLGRRACLGEALARMELFLYLCTLVQRFSFLPTDPNALPTTVGILGAALKPVSYEIRAVRRE